MEKHPKIKITEETLCGSENNPHTFVEPSEYKNWIRELKQRIRQSQIKAAVKVNTELLRLYWEATLLKDRKMPNGEMVS